MVIVPFTWKRNLRGLKEPTLFGHVLQLTTKVRYFGLTLDKELTWKAQLRNVINKAHRAFWACKGTFGKTCGLKPRVVYWIYTMVIRPILTCISMVWCPRIIFKVSTTELSKLETGLSGSHRGNEDDSNSCSGCPPGAPSPSSD
jgi:hypothetical protein